MVLIYGYLMFYREFQDTFFVRLFLRFYHIDIFAIIPQIFSQNLLKPDILDLVYNKRECIQLICIVILKI